MTSFRVGCGTAAAVVVTCSSRIVAVVVVVTVGDITSTASMKCRRLIEQRLYNREDVDVFVTRCRRYRQPNAAGTHGLNASFNAHVLFTPSPAVLFGRHFVLNDVMSFDAENDYFF